MVAFLQPMESPRIQAAMETLTGSEGRRALKAYQDTGDESEFRHLFDRLTAML